MKCQWRNRKGECVREGALTKGLFVASDCVCSLFTPKGMSAAEQVRKTRHQLKKAGVRL